MINRDGFQVRNDPGQQEVALLLRTLQTKLFAFLDAAPASDPRIQRIKSYWTGGISEIDKESEQDGSLAYSLNKNSIHICLRAPDGSLATENTATFVLLHELAHIASTSVHHTPEFWANFQWLVELSERLGFYRYEDHGEKNATICGHVLGPSPLTCVRNKTCSSTLQ
jgi:hypothetical protein